MRMVVAVERGEIAESVHEVHAVVVDGDGRLVLAAGDPARIACLRSSAKPFQALAAVEAGATTAFGFGSRELALMCASHGGEAVHVEGVEHMLRAAGFRDSDLECGAHPPIDPMAAAMLLRSGVEPSALHNNCSGKHAGMLTLARHLGADSSGYVASDHLVQRAIRRQLVATTGIRDIPIAVDGCSAPTYFVPLRATATLFRDLALGLDPSLATLRNAMTTHPELVAGRDRFDTVVMAAGAGALVSKGGAEGLQGIGVRGVDGAVHGVAVKASDGEKRATEAAAIAILLRLELLAEPARSALEPLAEPTRRNHRGMVVGRIRTVFEA